MPHAFDYASSLWPTTPVEKFFPDLAIQHCQQTGGSCVATGLSLLTRQPPETVRQHINTQNPVSWSDYLQSHGMKLAYCPTDLRRLRFYRDELLALDDLFAVSTYSADSAVQIGTDPDRDGWICGSHFVILHRQTVYDTRDPSPILFEDYPDVSRYVKRLFRVVPASHHRGL